MKIRHLVEVTGAEVDSLFNPVMTVCVTVYASPEEQAQAILRAKGEFEKELNSLLWKAVKLGQRLGKGKAD